MNTYAELIASANDEGITAVTVAQGMAAAEKALADYPTRCAQTVIVYATVEAKVMTRAAIAREAGISAMQVGRYYAAGQILAAHDSLDPVAVVTYANTHDKDECKAVAAMSDEDAATAVAGKPAKGEDEEKTPKSEFERDLDALERMMKRAIKVHDSRDAERIEAFRQGLYMIGDALEGIPASTEEEVA